MSAQDPKQAFIDYLSDPQLKREERGCLAKRGTISLLKEKSASDVKAYAASYTSTKKQKWYEAYCVVKDADGLWDCSRGFRTKGEMQYVVSESEHKKYGSQPWMKLSATKEDAY